MKKIFTLKGWRYEPEDDDLTLNCNDKVDIIELTQESALFKVNDVNYEIKREDSIFKLYEEGNFINGAIACNPKLPYFDKEKDEDKERFLEYITSIGLILYT